MEKRVDDVAGSIGRDIDPRSKLTGQAARLAVSRGSFEGRPRG